MSPRRAQTSSAYPGGTGTHTHHNQRHRTMARSWSLQPAGPRAPSPKRASHESRPEHQAKAQSHGKQPLRHRQTRTVPAMPPQAPRRLEDGCRAECKLFTNLDSSPRARTSPVSGNKNSRRSQWLQQTTDRLNTIAKHEEARQAPR